MMSRLFNRLIEQQYSLLRDTIIHEYIINNYLLYLNISFITISISINIIGMFYIFQSDYKLSVLIFLLNFLFIKIFTYTKNSMNQCIDILNKIQNNIKNNLIFYNDR